MLDESPRVDPGSIDAHLIRMVSRTEFSDLAALGEVSANTPVFDLTLTRLGDARAGSLETAAGRAWQRSLLPSD